MERFTRREFLHLGLDLAKGAAVTVALDACRLSSPTDEPKIVVGDMSGRENVFKKSPGYNGDTLRIFTKSGSYGHGSLLEKDGKLYVYTVEHVATLSRDRSSFLYIPDVGTAPLEYSHFTFSAKKPTDTERAALYLFGETNTKIIRDFILKGTIAPEKLIEDTPQIGEEVVIPRIDQGVLTNYKIVRYIKDWNLYQIESTAQYNIENCKGDSGSPVLKFEPIKDKPGFVRSLGIYGVLSEGEGFHPDPTVQGSRVCTSILYFRPND